MNIYSLWSFKKNASKKSKYSNKRIILPKTWFFYWRYKNGNLIEFIWRCETHCRYTASGVAFTRRFLRKVYNEKEYIGKECKGVE